jgi:hypothetical protein
MSQQRATFILRLWREEDAPAGVWLSQVEYLQAATTRHFADLTAAFHDIRAWLDQLEEAIEPQGSKKEER